MSAGLIDQASKARALGGALWRTVPAVLVFPKIPADREDFVAAVFVNCCKPTAVRGSERQPFGKHSLAGWAKARANADEQRWAAMNTDRPERDAVSERIIGCAFTVANTLGSGFLEKVYENALALELRAAGFAVEQQRPIGVTYKGVLVGDYFADLLVEGAVLIELKTVWTLDGAHRAQCINYLRATGKRLCLLINFGRPRIEVQRIAEDP
jgi:GxxExxY protein